VLDLAPGKLATFRPRPSMVFIFLTLVGNRDNVDTAVFSDNYRNKETLMFTLSTLSSYLYTINITPTLIAYLIIAAIVGLVAEFIIGWRLPFGIIGAIIAALVGIWLLTNVIQLNISGDPVIYGVPIFKALIGAILLVALWHLLTFSSWRRRRRYYRRYDRY
jgi:uncharacterized membrane protein YeaQ/YmgE (transglycosylase-associated protein family)